MRTAEIKRATAETEIALTLDLDGSGSPSLCLRKPKADPEHSDNYVVLNEFRGEMQTVTVNDEMYQTEGFFHVKPEEDAPWTAKDVVAFTSDFSRAWSSVSQRYSQNMAPRWPLLLT